MSTNRRLTRKIEINRADWWDPSYIQFTVNTRIHGTKQWSDQNLSDPNSSVATFIDAIENIDKVARVVRMDTFYFFIAFESCDSYDDAEPMLAKVVESICNNQSWSIDDTVINWYRKNISTEIRKLLK